MSSPMPIPTKHRLPEQNLLACPGSAGPEETKAHACLFRKYDVTRDSIRSRAVLASILPLLDHHGQSLALPFDENSPFSKSSVDGQRNLRECPMQKCRHTCPTPWDLIKHLLVCEEAPRGSVQCEQCDHSHEMTRLMSPTQLFRKVTRKRSPKPSTITLASSQHEYGSESDHSSADHSDFTNDAFMSPRRLPSPTQPLELPVEGFTQQMFRMRTSNNPELDSKELFEMIDDGNFEHTPEMSATYTSALEQGHVKSGLTPIQELAAIESITELDAPHTIFTPSTACSSTASRQRNGPSWSGMSQASTLLNKSPLESWQYARSTEPKIQQPLSEYAYPPATASSLGSTITTTTWPWLPSASLVRSPEELVSSRGTDAPCSSLYPSEVQQGTYQSVNTNAAEQNPLFAAANDHRDGGHLAFSSCPVFGSMNGQHCPMSSGAPDWNLAASTSTLNATDIYEQFQLPSQSLGGAHISAHGLGHLTTASVADSSVAIVESSGATKVWDTGSSISSYQSLARTNALRTKPAEPGRRKTQVDAAVAVAVAVADSDNHIYRCSYPNCKFEPKGQKKNRRSHLKRHMTRHDTRTKHCPFQGCDRGFPPDRMDNLTAHCKRKHDKNWRPEGFRGRKTSDTTTCTTLEIESESSLDKTGAGGYDPGPIDDQMCDSGLHGQDQALCGNLLEGISGDKDTEMLMNGMGEMLGDPVAELSSDEMRGAGGAHYSELEIQIAAFTYQFNNTAAEAWKPMPP